jgi:hypothetical protein
VLGAHTLPFSHEERPWLRAPRLSHKAWFVTRGAGIRREAAPELCRRRRAGRTEPDVREPRALVGGGQRHLAGVRGGVGCRDEGSQLRRAFLESCSGARSDRLDFKQRSKERMPNTDDQRVSRTEHRVGEGSSRTESVPAKPRPPLPRAEVTGFFQRLLKQKAQQRQPPSPTKTNASPVSDLLTSSEIEHLQRVQQRQDDVAHEAFKHLRPRP